MSRPSPEELKMVEGAASLYNFTPNLVTDVFKNRRGRWTSVRIWSVNDLGTLRKLDLFVTSANDKPIEDFTVVDFTFEKTKQMEELEDFYNNGVVSDEQAQDILAAARSEKIIVKAVDKVEEAFGNEYERKQQLQGLSFEDFLTYE